ncbi:MAG: hypothetical protein HKP61_10895 [Dactylosporangium sp.]|nr:hypothetical protein [Dactylosporangium sp.]NNJ61436.1 hypothetical protein [Dactylosporangium sp.]
MTALVLMRLRGYAVTGRVLAPLLAGLVVLGTLYGGGQAQVGEAYGVSAAVLLPVLAWQTKMLLDVEPDTQRRLAAIGVGSPVRECCCGLLAAGAAAVPVVLLAMMAPWILNGIAGPQYPSDLSLGAGMALGVWAHALLVPPAIVIGAWSSRAVTRTAGTGVTVLVAGTVGVVILGLQSSPVPWLAPPVLAVARFCERGGSWQALAMLTVWAVFWTAGAVVGYGALRRVRR